MDSRDHQAALMWVLEALDHVDVEGALLPAQIAEARSAITLFMTATAESERGLLHHSMRAVDGTLATNAPAAERHRVIERARRILRDALQRVTA